MVESSVQPARAGMGSAVRAVGHEGVRGGGGGVDGRKMRSSPPNFSSTRALSAPALVSPLDGVHVIAMGRVRFPLGSELHTP